jgi:hypothetical protein
VQGSELATPRPQDRPVNTVAHTLKVAVNVRSVT